MISQIYIYIHTDIYGYNMNFKIIMRIKNNFYKLFGRQPQINETPLF